MEGTSLFSRLVDQFSRVLTPSGNKYEEVEEVGKEPDACLGAPASQDDLVRCGIQPDDLRLLLYRTCSRRGRKILFDSLNVTEDGFYLQQTDTKFLKDVVGEFAFGSVEINFYTGSTFRYTLLKNRSPSGPEGGTELKYYTWALIYPHHNSCQSTVPTSLSLPCQQQPNSLGTNQGMSSSGGSGNSSGYYSSSLPTLKTSCNFSSKNSTSLPDTKIRISSKTTIALVLLTKTNLQYYSPLIETSLKSLKNLIPKIYLAKSFCRTLKSFVNSLQADLFHYGSLKTKYLGRRNHFKHLVNFKLITDYVNLLIGNRNCKVVIVTKKNFELAESLFYIHDLVKKHFVLNCNDSSYSSLGYHSYNNSSIEFLSTSNYSELESEEEEGDSSDPGHGNGRSNKASFYLDELEDEQTETKLALGDVKFMSSEEEVRLKPPIEIKLDFSSSVCRPVVKSNCIDRNLFSTSCSYNYCNGLKRFVSLVDNLLLGEVNYDYVHSITCEIIEVNLDKCLIRGINLENNCDTGGGREQIRRVRDIFDKIRELVELDIDQDKIEGYFSVHLLTSSK